MAEQVSAFQLDAREANLDDAQRRKMTNDNLRTDLQMQDGEDTDEAVYNFLHHNRKAADDYRNQYFYQVWLMCLDAYYGRKQSKRGDHDEKGKVDKEKKASNVYIRHAYIHVEASTSDLVNSLMRDKEALFRILSPYPNEEGLDRANALKRALMFQFTQKMKPTYTLHRWIQQGEMLGLSPLKPYYKFKMGRKTTRRPVLDLHGNRLGLRREVIDNAIICDRPDLAVPSTFNIWWNPDATGIFDIRWVIERAWYCIKELRNLAEMGVFRKDAVEELIDKYCTGEYVNEQDRKRTDIHHIPNDYDPVFAVDEYWSEDRLANFSNDYGVILRDRDNVYDDGLIPYLFYPSAAVIGQVPGFGQIEGILDLSDESNTKRNQRIDNIDMIINPQILAGPRAQLNTNTLTFVPRGVLRGTKEDIDVLTIPDATAPAFQEDMRIQQDMNDTNANFKLMRGEATTGKNTTATEASIQAQNMNSRKEIKVKYLNLQFYEAMRSIWQLNRQFGSSQLNIKTAGPDGVLLRQNPQNFYGEDWEFEFGGGGFLTNRVVAEQRLTQDLAQLGQTPMVQHIDWKRFTEMWLKNKGSDFPGMEHCLKTDQTAVLGFDRDPVQENSHFMMYMRPVEVTPGEDHSYHIQTHMPLLDRVEVPDEVKKLVQKHITQHYRYLQNDFQEMGRLGGRTAAQTPRGEVPAVDARTAALNMANAPGGMSMGGAG